MNCKNGETVRCIQSDCTHMLTTLQAGGPTSEWGMMTSSYMRKICLQQSMQQVVMAFLCQGFFHTIRSQRLSGSYEQAVWSIVTARTEKSPQPDNL